MAVACWLVPWAGPAALIVWSGWQQCQEAAARLIVGNKVACTEMLAFVLPLVGHLRMDKNQVGVHLPAGVAPLKLRCPIHNSQQMHWHDTAGGRRGGEPHCNVAGSRWAASPPREQQRRSGARCDSGRHHCPRCWAGADRRVGGLQHQTVRRMHWAAWFAASSCLSKGSSLGLQAQRSRLQREQRGGRRRHHAVRWGTPPHHLCC